MCSWLVITTDVWCHFGSDIHTTGANLQLTSFSRMRNISSPYTCWKHQNDSRSHFRASDLSSFTLLGHRIQMLISEHSWMMLSRIPWTWQKFITFPETVLPGTPSTVGTSSRLYKEDSAWTASPLETDTDTAASHLVAEASSSESSQPSYLPLLCHSTVKLPIPCFSDGTIHSLDPTLMGSSDEQLWSTFIIHIRFKVKCSF